MSVPGTASVVVIGGGVVGCSIAYHLARRGQRDVVVLERETVGAGTTSKAAGGIRSQFPTETEIRFSLEAIGVFERFQEEFGVDIGYRKIGYLFLISDPDDLAGYRERMALQRRLGVDVREIAPAEAKAIVPALRVDDLIAAVWGPTDGMAGPAEVTNAFARRARELGARIVEGVRRHRHRRRAWARARRADVAGRHHRAHRDQRGGTGGRAGRTAGRRRRGGPSAAAPHLLHGALPRDPRPGAAHHRPRQRLLLPQGDGAAAAVARRRRGHRRGLHGADGPRAHRRDGGEGAAPHSRSSRRRASPAAGPGCGR